MEHSIGSKAKYVDIYIGSKGVGVDTDWFITTKTSNPAVPTYMILPGVRSLYRHYTSASTMASGGKPAS